MISSSLTSQKPQNTHLIHMMFQSHLHAFLKIHEAWMTNMRLNIEPKATENLKLMNEIVKRKAKGRKWHQRNPENVKLLFHIQSVLMRLRNLIHFPIFPSLFYLISSSSFNASQRERRGMAGEKGRKDRAYERQASWFRVVRILQRFELGRQTRRLTDTNMYLNKVVDIQTTDIKGMIQSKQGKKASRHDIRGTKGSLLSWEPKRLTSFLSLLVSLHPGKQRHFSGCIMHSSSQDFLFPHFPWFTSPTHVFLHLLLLWWGC